MLRTIIYAKIKLIDDCEKQILVQRVTVNEQLYLTKAAHFH